MDIGKLKHRITIQEQKYIGQGPTGEVIYEWVTVAITWAQVQGISGREFMAAQTEQAGTTWKIIMRYIPGLKSYYRILLDGSIFNIKGILPNNDKTMITVMAESGVNNG